MFTWETVTINKHICANQWLYYKIKRKNSLSPFWDIFTLRYYVPLEKGVVFIWSTLNPLHLKMLCAKFGWNCRRKFETNSITTTTTDKLWSEKLTWAFGSGELMIVLSGLETNISRVKLFFCFLMRIFRRNSKYYIVMVNYINAYFLIFAIYVNSFHSLIRRTNPYSRLLRFSQGYLGSPRYYIHERMDVLK